MDPTEASYTCEWRGEEVSSTPWEDPGLTGARGVTKHWPESERVALVPSLLAGASH